MPILRKGPVVREKVRFPRFHLAPSRRDRYRRRRESRRCGIRIHNPSSSASRELGGRYYSGASAILGGR